MGHYAGVDYNLHLIWRPLSRLQYIYHGQPYASVFPPVRDLRFGPWRGLVTEDLF